MADDIKSEEKKKMNKWLKRGLIWGSVIITFGVFGSKRIYDFVTWIPREIVNPIIKHGKNAELERLKERQKEQENQRKEKEAFRKDNPPITDKTKKALLTKDMHLSLKIDEKSAWPNRLVKKGTEVEVIKFGKNNYQRVVVHARVPVEQEETVNGTTVKKTVMLETIGGIEPDCLAISPTDPTHPANKKPEQAQPPVKAKYPVNAQRPLLQTQQRLEQQHLVRMPMNPDRHRMAKLSQRRGVTHIRNTFG